MSSARKCHLLIDQPADGDWNMAVDEVLLEEVGRTETPVLRFYRWQRPTLSLGYFQSSAQRSQHPSSTSAELVRRLSGGGAILHDREFTYSLILPGTHPLAGKSQELYQVVHQVIATELNQLLQTTEAAWRAELCENSPELESRAEPFLCFQRRSPGDILLRQSYDVSDPATYKVVGSAQRRRRGTVLQHGSILGAHSTLAPELRGILDLAQSKTIVTELHLQLTGKLVQALSMEAEEYKLTGQLLRKVEQLQQAKYRSEDWTNRR